jgi:zinc-binding alcohol dehydrogenase/oxidoreductase
MKAVLFHGKEHSLTVRDLTKPVPTEKQVLIRLQYAALNHRDLWIRSEQLNHFPDGIILGSDGSGVIESVGEEIDPGLEGLEVVINPSLRWGNNPVVQGDSFKILGFPDNGTFAEYIAIARDHVFEKPTHLSMVEAAAVPLSGLTAYRALFSKARLRPGEKVLVTGIGGATALSAMKFAIAFKGKVYVTSSSDEKLKKAIDLGAEGGFNYKESDWVDKANKQASGFDVIIDGAAGEQFHQLTEVAAPGARIVLYGRTAGAVGSVPPRNVFWKQLSILGTTMGTRDEFLSMLDFYERHQLHPVIAQQFPLHSLDEAMVKLESSDQFGKIILQIV